MKLVVCEKCEAEYKIFHNMNDRFYVMEYCTFCGEPLTEEELQDEVELEGYDEDEDE
jgi:hydrogenase maturation factor HypF (carbamoyltransferase family)